MRRAAVAAIALALLAAQPAAAQTAGSAPRGTGTLSEPERYDRPPPGRERSAREVLRVAEAQPVMRSARAEHPRAYARAYLSGPGRWQVSLYEPREPRREELVQVVVDDRDGRVLEAWTGEQVAWPMARGY